MSWVVPFNRPTRTGAEDEYVLSALHSDHLAGDGPFTQRCEELLAGIVSAPRVLLTTSCTHALELAALLLDVGPDDEVVVPSFTFVSTAAAFALRGARIVFADVRPDTLNIDERLLPSLVTERTRAVVVVHYAGVGAELDAIRACLAGSRAVVVEDNAHGLFGWYRGRPLGSAGALSANSFHETKNVTCGEGGAIVVNDESLIERAEILREKGTERKRFFRGQVDKYTWVDLGSSYLASELNAAMLAAQLERAEDIQSARERAWLGYHEALDAWAERTGATLPVVPPERKHAYHLYHVMLPTLDVRTALIQHLRARSILAVFHYLPLHLSAMGRRYGGYEGQCPVTEDVSDRLLRLPLYTSITEHEQELVIDALGSFAAA